MTAHATACPVSCVACVVRTRGQSTACPVSCVACGSRVAGQALALVWSAHESHKVARVWCLPCLVCGSCVVRTRAGLLMHSWCVMVGVQAGMQAQQGLHRMAVAGIMPGAQPVHGQGAGVAGNLYAQGMQGMAGMAGVAGMQERLAAMPDPGAVGGGMRGPAGRCGRGDGGGQTDCCSRARTHTHTHAHRCAIGGISW